MNYDDLKKRRIFFLQCAVEVILEGIAKNLEEGNDLGNDYIQGRLDYLDQIVAQAKYNIQTSAKYQGVIKK